MKEKQLTINYQILKRMSNIVKVFRNRKPEGVIDNKIMQFMDQDPRIEAAYTVKLIHALLNTRCLASLLQRRKESSRILSMETTRRYLNGHQG